MLLKELLIAICDSYISSLYHYISICICSLRRYTKTFYNLGNIIKFELFKISKTDVGFKIIFLNRK